MSSQKKRSTAEPRRTRGAARGKTSSARRTVSTKSRPHWALSLTLDQQLDVLGLVLFLGGILAALGLITPDRMPGLGPLLLILIRGLGGGVFAIPLGMIASGAWLLVRRFERVPRPRPSFLLGLFLLYGALLVTLEELGGAGGAVGARLAQGLTENLGAAGALLVLLGTIWMGLMLTFRLSPERPLEWAIRTLRGLRLNRTPVQNLRIHVPSPVRSEPPADPLSSDRSPRILGEMEAQEVPAEAVGPLEPAGELEEIELPVQIAPEGPKWTLPRLEEILDPGEEEEINEADLREKARIIEETLRSLGVEARVVE
ncbi:MAG: DNA translocase FtsK 4TM domain-containing protein, partial [Thermoflexus sp.]